MNSREQGQSQASADALAAWCAATDEASQIRCEVRELERKLRSARKEARSAGAAEDAAYRAYLATPYPE